MGEAGHEVHSGLQGSWARDVHARGHGNVGVQHGNDDSGGVVGIHVAYEGGSVGRKAWVGKEHCGSFGVVCCGDGKMELVGETVYCRTAGVAENWEDTLDKTGERLEGEQVA